MYFHTEFGVSSIRAHPTINFHLNPSQASNPEFEIPPQPIKIEQTGKDCCEATGVSNTGSKRFFVPSLC